MKRSIICLIFLGCLLGNMAAESGYELWLRYRLVDDMSLLDNYRKLNAVCYFPKTTSEQASAAKAELFRGMEGLLGKLPAETSAPDGGTLWIGVRILEVCSSGFPHSDISGSSDICSSPKLFAAYHVFHRLLVPRHPPYALFIMTKTLI